METGPNKIQIDNGDPIEVPESVDAHQRWWDFLFEFLPEDADEQLLILKGHLIVEVLLNKTIEAGCKNSRYLKIDRLAFERKITLARSLSEKKVADECWLWGAIGKLNAIRNDMAHDIYAQAKDKLIPELINLAIRSSERIPDEPRQVELRKALVLMFVPLYMPVAELHPPVPK